MHAAHDALVLLSGAAEEAAEHHNELPFPAEAFGLGALAAFAFLAELPRDEAVAAIGRLSTAAPPGAGYLYSNAGYTLLAAIVEEAAGVPYREALTAGVLRLPGGDVAGGLWDGEPPAPGPRAIGRLDDGTTGETGEFAGPHWALTGNGDVAMSMPDLAAWTHALFTGQVVSPESAAAIAAPAVDHDDGSAEAPGWVRLDAPTTGETLLAAAGGGGDVGHEVVVVWAPERERAIAIASNAPDVPAERLLDAIGPALLTGEPLPGPEVVGPVDPADVDALVGTYALDTGDTLEVTARDDRLVVAALGATAVATLFPLPHDAAQVAVLLERIHRLIDGLPERRWSVSGDLLGKSFPELVRIARELGTDRHLVAKAAETRHVVGAEPHEELLRRGAQQLQIALHAARDVEHHDQLNRLRAVVEDGDRLRLALVANLEVLLHQRRHQTPVLVGDGGVDTHRVALATEDRLLRRGAKPAESDGSERPESKESNHDV